MSSFYWFVVAAFFEIAGCYVFWLWLRLDKSVLWVVPGVISLVLFALALARAETQFAGRAFAAYGGIYIMASLVWMAVVEGGRPLLSDYAGVLLCVLGSVVILLGPRWASAF